jgi:hypothetical protein
MTNKMNTQDRNLINNHKTLISLVFFITALAIVVTLAGIISDHGPGQFEYKSIRGETITIYGKGIYQHMSAEVAIQGIAQDYVTLFIALPLLLLALYFSLKGSFKWRFILSGTLGYFLVTYLFYLVMAMYNQFFLAYSALMGASFFALAITLLSFEQRNLSAYFHKATPVKFIGGFLIFNSIIITFLWLSIVLPPLLNGTLYPKALEHYTTLIVQGIDLGLLLPLAFVSGYLLISKKIWAICLHPCIWCFYRY